MTWPTQALAFAAIALAVQPPPAERPQTDRDRLQGKWKVVSSQFEGRDGTAAYRDRTSLVFEGDRAYFTDGAVQSKPVKFGLDETKGPKTIDLIAGGDQVTLGIYQLDGDTLKLCLSRSGRRPGDFATKPGDQTNLMTLRREKP